MENKIGNSELKIIVKPIVPKSQIVSHMITTKKTYDTMINGNNEAEEIQFNEMKMFVDAYIKKMKTKNQIQINYFTKFGWRAGFAFTKNNGIDWKMEQDQYHDGNPIDIVYAIQILVF
jgi:hypothetical protein